jgi:hypothetical protein
MEAHGVADAEMMYKITQAYAVWGGIVGAANVAAYC